MTKQLKIKLKSLMETFWMNIKILLKRTRQSIQIQIKSRAYRRISRKVIWKRALVNLF